MRVKVFFVESIITKIKYKMNVVFLSIVPRSELYSCLAEEFVKNGHTVSFISPCENEDHIDIINGVEYVYFHAGKMLNVGLVKKGFSNLLFPYRALSATKLYLRKKTVDLILMSTPPLGYYKSVEYIKKHTKAKFYLILRDIHPEATQFFDLHKRLPMAYKYLLRQAKKLYALSDKIGCMSPHSVNLIRNRYMCDRSDDVELLPNWGKIIEYKNPDYSIRTKYKLDDKFLLIYGGNMGIGQNLDIFIRLAKDKQHLNDVLFLFVGNGTERERLRDLVKRENLSNLQIWNQIPYDDYNDLLKTMDVGIITLHPKASFANIPSKTISYLQYKIPILASIDRIGDYPQYIIERGQCGLWSYADDYQKLSDNFDKLYFDKELRLKLGNNGYQFFMDNFTVEEAYTNIINSLNI